ncbi:MAG: phasin family protein [Burkholderiales bacterium]|nr:phasin family protein [Burkholderiales bacterium]
MVKKLKALAAEKNGTLADSQLAAAVKDSAQQIWLAGLGAFSKAQEEGGKVYKALIKEGSSLQKRTMQMTEDRVNEVTSKMTKLAGGLQKQANGTWDKLETVFEQRVERALQRLGVPTHTEIAELTRRVEALTASVQKLSGSRPAASQPVARKRSTKTSARAGA